MLHPLKQAVERFAKQFAEIHSYGSLLMTFDDASGFSLMRLLPKPGLPPAQEPMKVRL
jgi:hypothetical protein